MIVHRHHPRNKIPLPVAVEAWLVVGSIIGATYLIQTDAISVIVAHTQQFGLLSSFVEGFFFTSILTTAVAIVAIFQSAVYTPAWELALIGGIGAVCGDLLLFRFVKSRLVAFILKKTLSPHVLRFGAAVTSGPLWWLGPLGGAIVIASPLPDEIGLVMMGLSNIRLIQFIPIVFIANASGIYLMALTAQNLM